MGIVTGIVLYLIIWWTVLFMVLPWGVRPSQQPLRGTTPSAPERPYIFRKFMITSLIAGVVWVLIYSVVRSGWISFRTLIF